MPNIRLSRPARRFMRLGRQVRRAITIAVIVVVLAGVGATAWAMAGPSGPAYRTATVTRADVTQTLQSTGTIEPVNQANVSFPVSGQVASVSVSLGSDVKAGQVIAQLSTTSLASQVSSAEYTVAQDTVRLATDQASEASSSTTSTTSSTGSGGSGSGGSGSTGSGSSGSTGSGSAGRGSGSTGGTGSGSGGSTTAVAKAQAAVLAAQKALAADLAAAKPLMSDVTTLCGTTSTPTPSPTGTAVPSPSATPSPSTPQRHSVVQSPSPTSTHPATPSPSATASASVAPSATTSARLTSVTTSATTPPPGGSGTTAPAPTTCQQAVTQMLSAENGIATDEQKLATAETALSKALSSGSGSGGTGSGGSGSGGTGSGGTGSGGTGSGGTGSGGTGSGGTGSGGTGSGGTAATAQQVTADQASLTAANAQLSVAQQNMAAATLIAPISGTIAQVNITPGQQVTGSDSTANFVIEGAGGEEATTTISGTDVGQVRVGQRAAVTLDGSANVISGEVVSIGILSSSSSAASYPVTIGLTSSTPTLFAGSDATVSITLAKASNVVAVPTSAVTSLGSLSFVTVLTAGKATNVRVTVGATGPVLTQVSSGLSVGEQVVLANMSTPLPTNSNPFATRGLTGGGGFGGGPPGGGVTVGGGGGKSGG